MVATSGVACCVTGRLGNPSARWAGSSSVRVVVHQRDAAGVNSPRTANLAAVVQYPEPLPGILNESLYPDDSILGCDCDVLAVDPRVIRYRLLRLLCDLLVGQPGSPNDHFLTKRFRPPCRILGTRAGGSEEGHKENCKANSHRGELTTRCRSRAIFAVAATLRDKKTTTIGGLCVSFWYSAWFSAALRRP